MEDAKLNPLIRSFIKELDLLSNKYGVIIDGCDCCGNTRTDTISGKGNYTFTVDSLGYAKHLEWRKDK